MSSRRNRQRSPEPSGDDEESELMSAILPGNRIRVTNTRASVPRFCSVHSAIFLSLQSQPTATKVCSMKAEFSSANGQRSATNGRRIFLRCIGQRDSGIAGLACASRYSEFAILQCFPSKCLCGARNGLQVAV